jgi:hypothetical protein
MTLRGGTTLYETLAYRVQNDFGLGQRLHLQLDNTTSENKNLTMIGAVGLLVQRGIFAQATIFFMPKASFNYDMFIFMTSPPPSPPGDEVEDEEGDHEEEDHGEEDQEEDPDSAPIIGYPYGPYTLYSPVAPEELGEENVVFELNTDGVPLYPPIEERADDVFEGDSESGRSGSHHTPSPPPVSGQPAPTARVAAIFGPSFTPQVVPPSRSGTEGLRSGYDPFDANALAFDRLREAITDIGRRRH